MSDKGFTSLLKLDTSPMRYRVFTIVLGRWAADEFINDPHEAAKEFTRQILLHH